MIPTDSEIISRKDKVKKKLGITGCEQCPHFREVDRGKGGHSWRQYCGLGNFNINTASYEVEKTSHGKNRCRTQAKYEWEFDIPNRCPLLKEPK